MLVNDHQWSWCEIEARTLNFYRQGINRFRPNRRTLPLSKLSQRFNDSLSNMNKNGHWWAGNSSTVQALNIKRITLRFSVQNKTQILLTPFVGWCPTNAIICFSSLPLSLPHPRQTRQLHEHNAARAGMGWNLFPAAAFSHRIGLRSDHDGNFASNEMRTT